MTTLGNKHECFSCGAKFYDLGKSRTVCPTCGTDQADEDRDEASAPATPAKSKKKKPAKPKASAKPADKPEPSVEATKGGSKKAD